jgi:hypothetical protein
MTKNEEIQWKIFFSIFLSKLQLIEREYPALQKLKFIKFFSIFVGYFALLDPDTDPGTPLNLDLQHWLRDRHCEESAEFFTPERLATCQRQLSYKGRDRNFQT